MHLEFPFVKSHPHTSSYEKLKLNEQLLFPLSPVWMNKKKGNEEGEMFYSPGLLSREGPLGVIWIASHCCRKLRKIQVVEADVSSSVGTTSTSTTFLFSTLLLFSLSFLFIPTNLVALVTWFGFEINGCHFFMIAWRNCLHWS